MNKIGELAIDRLQQTQIAVDKAQRQNLSNRCKDRITRNIRDTPNTQINECSLFVFCVCTEMNNISKRHEKIWLCASMIAIKASVAICRLPICHPM